MARAITGVELKAERTNHGIIVGAAKQPKEYRMFRVRIIALSIGLATGLNLAMAQAPPPAQTPPPAAAAPHARRARRRRPAIRIRPAM